MVVPRDQQTMSSKLSRLAELAREDRARQFTAIAHLLTPAALAQALASLRREASAGVDGVTYQEYAPEAPARLAALHARLKNQQYRAQPLRRGYIPKENGNRRPIAIPALEDKIVQKATVTLLNAIYEQDFLECSYGCRPGRSPHQALDQLAGVICRGRVGYVLEADLVGYFDAVVRKQLLEMVERRIKDGSILRLIRKWLHAGILAEGRLLHPKTGTGQGEVISPLLANIYLHYVLDEWLETEVKPRLRGAAYAIRYMDDFVLCFQYREDAERVLQVLPRRFGKYGLTLHPEKTRRLAFGRAALEQAEERGTGKPATFDFLGFTHIATWSRQGRFTIHLRTARKRYRRSVAAVMAWCREHLHELVGVQAAMLNAKLRGHYEYYGRPTNYRRLWQFFRAVRRIWRRWLNRRTRVPALDWPAYAGLLGRHPLLRPRITHPWARPGSLT